MTPLTIAAILRHTAEVIRAREEHYHHPISTGHPSGYVAGCQHCQEIRP